VFIRHREQCTGDADAEELADVESDKRLGGEAGTNTAPIPIKLDTMGRKSDGDDVLTGSGYKNTSG